MTVKIGDFGLACQLESSDDKSNAICGTPNYVAPEIIKGSSDGYSFEVDVWSLGVIIYKLIIGVNPFNSPSV
jgi:polo-like kinase 1